MASLFAAIMMMLYMNRSASVYCQRLLPRIAIATNIISVKESNTSNFDSVQVQGAGIDLGMEHLRNTYGDIFNFSHTYLMDKTRPEVTLLWDDVENFVAKFYYENTENVEGLALLSPCAMENVRAVKLTKAFRILHGCSAAGGFDLLTNPQHFSLSIYQNVIMFSFITSLFKENQWSVVAGLIDSSSIGREYVSRVMHSKFQATFNGVDPDPAFKNIQYHILTYQSSKGYSEVEWILRKMSEVSRVVFLFGSGKSSMMVLRTAEKLGMTNGDYVFFLVTLGRGGPSPDNQDDTWWKVTDENADLGTPDRGYVSKSTIVISYVSPYKAESVRVIREKIIQTARKNFNFIYKNNEVPGFLYTIYEEFVVYGVVLNETYTAMGRILNGIEMGPYIRNRTFILPTSQIPVSSDGFRLSSVLGEIMDPLTGEYTASLLFYHERKLISVVSPIDKMWPNGKWPPPNEPACGFQGNRCQESLDGTIWVVVGSTCGFLVLTITSAFFLWRILRYQLVLFPSTWWLIIEISELTGHLPLAELDQ